MKKRKIIIFILIFILFLIFMSMGIKYGIKMVNNNIKTEMIKDITFKTYSNENGILKILVIAEDTENGIDKILYTSEDGKENEINCYNVNYKALDFSIYKNGEYIFEFINGLGEKIEKKLIIDDEYRNNLININIDTEKEISTKGKVTIDYHGNEDKKRMYKIGENGKWQDYIGEFEIDSYDIIEKQLQDKTSKTVTIYAKIEDNAKNVINIQKIAQNIDVDIADVPVIEYNGENRNVVLTKYGVYLDENIEINVKYDDRSDITNYYSFDNGKTWNLYTKSLITNETNIIAKSVKNDSGLDITKKQNCNNILYSKNILAEAYDADLETYTYATNKHIILNNDLGGCRVKLYINCPAFNHVNIVFYKEDGETRVGESGYWHTNYALNYLTLTIPEEAKYIAIVPTSQQASYSCNLYNIEIDSEPIGDTLGLYPYMDNMGIKNEKKYKIQYFETAVKKLYSYDNENWNEYVEEGITLEKGQTVYAKSIDKKGNESKMLTYENELEDILGEEAYDGNDDTKTYAYNKILYINPEVWNKQIRMKIEAKLYSRVNIRFLNENNEIIKEYSRANNTYDENFVIPENTKKITWKYTDGNRAPSYIYDISFAQ